MELSTDQYSWERAKVYAHCCGPEKSFMAEGLRFYLADEGGTWRRLPAPTGETKEGKDKGHE